MSQIFSFHVPFEVADRSVCRRVPQQRCLSPPASYYVMTRAMSCDTLPLCVEGGGAEMGGASVCVCVCVGACVCVCVWFARSYRNGPEP